MHRAGSRGGLLAQLVCNVHSILNYGLDVTVDSDALH